MSSCGQTCTHLDILIAGEVEEREGLFNPLIVWNNPSGVDVLLTEKPGGWFAQTGTENCPRVRF